MLGYFTGDIGGIDLGIDLYGTAVSDLHSVSVGFNHLNTRKARARASCIFRGHLSAPNYVLFALKTHSYRLGPHENDFTKIRLRGDNKVHLCRIKIGAIRKVTAKNVSTSQVSALVFVLINFAVFVFVFDCSSIVFLSLIYSWRFSGINSRF